MKHSVKIKRLKIIGFLILFIPICCFAQSDENYSEEFRDLYNDVFDGDSIDYLVLPTIPIINDPYDRLKYLETKRKLEKIWPYFLIAQEVLVDLEAKEEALKKRHFRRYKRDRKKDLYKRFEKELKALRISEGKLLVKLISRQTGVSMAELLKHYNPNIKVWGFNLIARRYGYDLKEIYDVAHEDNYYIELALESIAPSVHRRPLQR
ncbi:MAG: DUF4294 domain-containing protein [Chitinophagales bacterium]